MQEFLNQIKQCTECQTCVDLCPTWQNTENPLFTPVERLKTALSILEGNNTPTEEMIESMYNCPMCMICEHVCPEEIKVSAIVQKTREELVRNNLGPLDRHKTVLESIIEKGNSVNGDPDSRLEWMGEEAFTKHQSDTLLYLGCLPSYLVKESALSTYLVLKKLKTDFMILEDEGCCGTYIYQCGKKEMAEEYFAGNVEKFKTLGIKKIIVPCNGCFKCFKYFYPALLGNIEFEVQHTVEVIYNALKDYPGTLKKIRQTLTYQDPCRLSRGEGLTEEPREILKMCGADLQEMENNRELASCCGAGAGIRSVYRKLSTNIAERLLKSTGNRKIVSSCPFCTFNLGFTSRKKRLEKEVLYFTQVVLKSLLS